MTILIFDKLFFVNIKKKKFKLCNTLMCNWSTYFSNNKEYIMDSRKLLKVDDNSHLVVKIREDGMKRYWPIS